MTTPVEVGNGRAGVKRIIDDLQNEHTRFQARRDALKQKGSDPGFDHQNKHIMMVAYIEDKLDYLELLIRRYRGWLHE